MHGIAIGSTTDRRALFTETARRHGLPAVIIEKDFWVCWALKQVMELEPIGPHLIFKGGTSLSKAFGIIQRFSEDIDLSIQRNYLGFAGDTDPEWSTSKTKRAKSVLALRQNCNECVRTLLHPALNVRFQELLGSDGWALTTDEEDANTLNFIYPSAAPTGRSRGARSWRTLPYLRSAIKLDFGAGSDPYPVNRYPISPYAAEAFPHVFREPACSVTVLEAERTFWEKATLAHAEYHRPADKSTPLRTSRHYYDLYQLAQHERGRRAVADRELLARVAEHKSVYFASGWAHYETAVSGGLRLVPNEARQKDLAHDYSLMRDMFFGPSPTFEEILATLQALEVEINASRATET